MKNLVSLPGAVGGAVVGLVTELEGVAAPTSLLDKLGLALVVLGRATRVQGALAASATFGAVLTTAGCWEKRSPLLETTAETDCSSPPSESSITVADTMSSC